MKGKINNFLLRNFGYTIGKDNPRHSIRYAKRYFGNRKIIIIEVGVYEGINALSMFQELSVEKMYLIDPYEEIDDIYQKASNKLKEYYRRIKWIIKSSDDAINDLPMADFIYLDGNHNYHQVKKDMNNYWERVKVDGIFAGHDIFHKGVAQAFVEFCCENKLKPNITRTDWWVVKK